MSIVLQGIDSDHKKAIAREVQLAIEAFDRIGPSAAHDACEAKRKEIIDEVNAGSTAYDIGPDRPVKTNQQGVEELSQEFEPFVRPSVITVEFTPADIPGAQPYCPMAVVPGSPVIQVCADYIDANLNYRGLSVRDLTFHELVHICGDPKDNKFDNIPRMNWVAVEALKRATQALPP